MSVWILASPFTAQQEQKLAEQLELPLPFGDLPDLSQVNSEQGIRRILTERLPDAAPETITRQADMHWQRLGQLAAGDLIVMPLHDQKLALAEVVKHYRYRPPDHVTEVRWLETSLSPRKIPGIDMLITSAGAMRLIENADARKPVYALLKRPYNRFAKWQWLLGALIVMQAMVMISGMLKSN